MFTRRISGAVAVAMLLALTVLPGSAASAATASCWGDGSLANCHGLDPANTVRTGTSTLCSADAVSEDPTTPATARPYIDIRYSANCRAAWMRVIGVPQGVKLHLRVTGTLDGPVDSWDDVVSVGNVLNYTFMVNAPNGLRANQPDCNDIVTVTATADFTPAGLHSSFSTPRTNIGGVTC